MEEIQAHIQTLPVLSKLCCDLHIASFPFTPSLMRFRYLSSMVWFQHIIILHVITTPCVFLIVILLMEVDTFSESHLPD